MDAQLSPSLKQFINTHPYLYRKLYFWANQRDLGSLTMQVNQYLTELVLETEDEGDRAALLQRWSRVLTPQERIGLAQLTPILIGTGFVK